MKTIYISFLFLPLFFFAGCQTDNNGNVLPQTPQEYNIFQTTGCDQVIDKHFYTICYDYNYKGARFVAYSLDGTVVNNPNIDERPSFYEEVLIPQMYRSRNEDYIGSGYDRGHLASDASFDYNQTVLESVYSLANIVPQDPDVNRYAWIDTEYLERDKAVEFGRVNVVIAVSYGDNPLRIGEDTIAVANGFYKKIENEAQGYEACFYYENIPYDVESDHLDVHEIACSYFPFY